MIEGFLTLKKKNNFFDFKFKIPLDGIIGIIGPSGSGKSMFLRLLAGLEQSDFGELSVNKKIWQDSRSFLPPQKRSIGFVFQNSTLFPHYTVLQNLKIGQRNTSSKEKLSLHSLIKVFDLEPFLNRYPKNLSGGESQRVEICRAIISNPDLILLDEPLSGLDPESKIKILPYLIKIQKEFKLSFLMVSHNLAEIKLLCRSVIQIKNGKIVKTGTKSDFDEEFLKLSLPSQI